MATQAKVTSTEALEAFRAKLIIYLTKARRALDDAGEEVRRMRQWLQHDQRMHWEGELRRRTKRLEQAQQELMSAQLSSHQAGAVMARQMALIKAQNELVEAEGKMRKLKAWNRNYDTVADPVVKRMDRMRQSLDELPKAILYLAAVQKTLEEYADSAGPASVNEPATPESAGEGEPATVPVTAPSSPSEPEAETETQPATDAPARMD
jgi:DNA repair ATPase RecN